MTPPPLRVLQGGRSRPVPSTIGSRLLAGLILWLIIATATLILWLVDGIVWPLIASASTSSSSAPLTPATIAFWRGVAKCETGAHWQGLGSTYQGGLGFYWSTWDTWAGELGLARRYPDAGDAPPIVQIRVADYGRRVHAGYWGCIA